MFNVIDVISEVALSYLLHYDTGLPRLNRMRIRESHATCTG